MPPARPLAALALLAALSAAPLAAQTTHTVTLSGMTFSPQNLTIEAGDTVLWDNVAGFHNVNGTLASYPSNPEGFGNDVASAPWTFEFTFTAEGEYGYNCDVHGAPGDGMFGTITVTGTSAVEDALPAGLALSALYPNPFRDETAFTLTAAHPAPIRVTVYDVLGREVEVLHDGLLPAGTPTRITWTPATARTGLYLVRVEGATFETTQRVIRVR